VGGWLGSRVGRRGVGAGAFFWTGAGGVPFAEAAPDTSALEVAATVAFLAAVGGGELWAAGAAAWSAVAALAPLPSSAAVGGGAPARGGGG